MARKRGLFGLFGKRTTSSYDFDSEYEMMEEFMDAMEEEEYYEEYDDDDDDSW